MTVRQRFFKQLETISLDGIDIPLAIILFIIVIIIALKFGKKDEGKTIFTASQHHVKPFGKDDTEGYI